MCVFVICERERDREKESVCVCVFGFRMCGYLCGSCARASPPPHHHHHQSTPPTNNNNPRTPPLPPPINTAKVVAKITGVLPSTARNFQQDPKIANWQDYEMRYNSFSTIAMERGGPTIDTVDDAAFVRKYASSEDWQQGKRSFRSVGRVYAVCAMTPPSPPPPVGPCMCCVCHDAHTHTPLKRFPYLTTPPPKYQHTSIVVGPSPDKSCGLYNETSDLFLTTTYRGAVADYWVSKHLW